MHREGYADGADGGFGGYGQMASGYPGLGIVEGGGETRVAGWGNARAEGGSGTASDEGRPTVRDGAHHITMWSWTFACGRARRRGFGGGRVGVGLAERGGAKPPRNEQRTTDAFEGAVARSRRGARASHRHVRELSRGDDEFRRDGASDVGIVAFERSRTPTPSDALATDSQATDSRHRARRGGRLRESPESPSSDPRVGASIERLARGTREVPARARTSSDDPRGRPELWRVAGRARGKRTSRGKASRRRTLSCDFFQTVIS